MHVARIIGSVLLGLFALLFWYAAFTVPAVTATPYMIFALVLTTATYFVSPFRFHRTRTQ